MLPGPRLLPPPSHLGGWCPLPHPTWEDAAPLPSTPHPTWEDGGLRPSPPGRLPCVYRVYTTCSLPQYAHFLSDRKRMHVHHKDSTELYTRIHIVHRAVHTGGGVGIDAAHPAASPPSFNPKGRYHVNFLKKSTLNLGLLKADTWKEVYLTYDSPSCSIQMLAILQRVNPSKFVKFDFFHPRRRREWGCDFSAPVKQVIGSERILKVCQL